jgi:hypothetical protein
MGDLSSIGATTPRDLKIDLSTGELVIVDGAPVLVSGAAIEIPLPRSRLKNVPAVAVTAGVWLTGR